MKDDTQQDRTASQPSLDGKTIPDVAFRVLDADGRLRETTARELLGSGTVALFALPGAFTPTCSNAHVPRFNQLAGEFRAHGVGRIVCVAVNDPYVMAAWARDQHADEIVFVPDTHGELTRRLGMLVDRPDAPLGPRSRRYSALVREGVIEKSFVEPDAPGDPFEVSDADTLLAYLDPSAKALQSIALFVRAGCPHCARARALLEAHRLPFEEIRIGGDVSVVAVRAVTGRSTVPQVFIGGRHVGGADDLERFLGERRGPPAAAARPASAG